MKRPIRNPSIIAAHAHSQSIRNAHLSVTCASECKQIMEDRNLLKLIKKHLKNVWLFLNIFKIDNYSVCHLTVMQKWQQSAKNNWAALQCTTLMTTLIIQRGSWCTSVIDPEEKCEDGHDSHGCGKKLTRTYHTACSCVRWKYCHVTEVAEVKIEWRKIMRVP